MLLDTNPHDNVITDTIRYLNNYETVWNVNGVAKKEGHYSVAVYWKGFQRSGLVNERGGICIGTTPNLTMENNEFIVYAKRISSYTNSYYVIMGDKPCLPMKFYTEQQNISFDDNGRQILSSSPIPFTITESPASFQSVKFMEENWVNMPLEYGKTYYYRTFKQGDVMHNGELKTVTIYDVEKSFRVPRVMEDAGYTPTIITDEAIAAFPSNFPEGVTVPKWEEIKPLWDIWQETDEGKQAISKGDVTTEAFDILIDPFQSLDLIHQGAAFVCEGREENAGFPAESVDLRQCKGDYIMICAHSAGDRDQRRDVADRRDEERVGVHEF